MQVFIVFNWFEGWKVVADGTHVDCTKEIFKSDDFTRCVDFCKLNGMEIKRICE